MIRPGARCMVPSLCLLMLVAGCGRAPIRWRYADFDSVHAESRQAEKLLFVYFRSWVSLDCTKFEDEVLLDDRVVAELRGTTNLVLEHGSLARRWGLNTVPSYALIAPDGRIVDSAVAPITAEQLITSLRRAKQEIAPEAAPPAE